MNQEKQMYLKDNILGKGYDANDFVEHMSSLKGISITIKKEENLSITGHSKNYMTLYNNINSNIHYQMLN